MSIKECLEAFVAHVQSLREEDEAGDDGYTKEFQMLKQQSNLYRMEGTFPTTEGEREYNKRKNRYKDILPFDYTRVVLPTIAGLLGSDYINANFMKGATGDTSYIASQGPLTHTVADFWRLIWYNKVKVIIMTANEYEGGKMKCACYWPKTPEERQYGDVSVTLMDEHERGSKDFIVRQLCAKKGDEIRIIHQLHYIAWPDHAVPASVKPLLEMVALARDIQPDDLPPLLVHCSAGCGRTGTLCAIDYAWTLLKMGQITPELSLYDIIYEMRRQRPSSVQALDQYILVHHAVAQLFSRHVALINQHYNLQENTPTTTTETTLRTGEGQYENVPSSAFVDTSLDLPEVCVSAPTSAPEEDHYANVSATSDVVQKAIVDTVAHLIRLASTSGLHLVPIVKPTEPLRYAPSPRIRPRRNEVENGYGHIQLKHPLPIPRKARMERNSSSSSSRSSTSSISGGQPEVREPIKSEPDYAVLSQFKSGDVPVGPTGAPIILQADGGEFMNTGTGPTTQSKSRGEFENPCIVFTSPGAVSHVYENTDTLSTSVVREQATSSGGSDNCMTDSLEAEVVQSLPDQGAMRPDQGTLRHEHSHGTLPQTDQRGAVPEACSPKSSQPDLLSETGHVKMEVNPLYEDTQTIAPQSFEGIMVEDNVLYEQSSASVRKKWPTHRSGGPHSPGSYDVPPAASTSSSSAHIPPGGHPVSPPKSPMISSTDGAFGTTSRSPEADARRKPLPLPKPKTSPTSPDRSVAQPSDMHNLSKEKTPTSSAAPGPVPANYSYADPNALGKWSLQHVARNVPLNAVLEDGDYAQLKNPRRPAVSPSAGQPTVPPRSTSAGLYEDVSEGGAFGITGNGQRESLSDDDSPQVPPKSQDLYSSAYEPAGDDDSITGQMSRSLDTLSESVTTGVLTFGRKLKQKVQQTFGKTPGSPPEGLMLGSPPGSSSSDSQNNTRGMAIFYKGMDISFPHRVPAPRGPRSQTGVTSPDGPSRTQHAARH